MNIVLLGVQLLYIDQRTTKTDLMMKTKETVRINKKKTCQILFSFSSDKDRTDSRIRRKSSSIFVGAEREETLIRNDPDRSEFKKKKTCIALKNRLLRQDHLDLSFWSFLTFLHHGIEEVERHLLWKFHKIIQWKSWSNVPPKLLACIRFLYKVVHKNGRLRKFNRAREIEFNFFITRTILWNLAHLFIMFMASKHCLRFFKFCLGTLPVDVSAIQNIGSCETIWNLVFDNPAGNIKNSKCCLQAQLFSVFFLACWSHRYARSMCGPFDRKVN